MLCNCVRTGSVCLCCLVDIAIGVCGGWGGGGGGGGEASFVTLCLVGSVWVCWFTSPLVWCVCARARACGMRACVKCARAYLLL